MRGFLSQNDRYGIQQLNLGYAFVLTLANFRKLSQSFDQVLVEPKIEQIVSEYDHVIILLRIEVRAEFVTITPEKTLYAVQYFNGRGE